FFDVYVMDLATRKARRVLENDATWSVQRWNPGGASLIIKKQESNVNNTLYELDLVGGRLRELTPHSGDASYDNVNWPEGSEWVYLTTDQDREFSGLARLHVKTAKLERLAETKWDVTDLLVSSKGRWAAWITNEDSYSRLRVGTLAELSRPDAVAVVAMPGGVGDTLSFSEDEAVLAFAWAAATQPSDIWALNPGAGTTTWQVTHSSLAGLDPKKFVAPTLVRFPTFDGRQIPALLFKPAGDPPAAGFPVVLAIHGGPEAQEQPWFSTVYQFLLSRGFAVLAPNIRGSTGYGRTYVHLDDSRKRGDAIEDVAWAVKYVGTVPGLNARRVAVMGGSYGGYMTLAALTFHPSLFAAGVDIVGIANFETFLANTGPWRRKLRIAEYGDPEKDLEYLRKFSPIHKVDLIEAPLMVIHGRQDPRVPLSEAEQIVKSLQTRGRPVEFLLFDDEGHGLAKIQNRQKAYSAVADFLDKHLKAP
ncbi:MAG: S9 family peptidase, partial [Armatimonadetes bacterium]|nr:S9 family peptidase [Armatimonadota bacterium]